MTKQPLISDGTVDVGVGLLLFFVGGPIWAVWRTWRFLRTGK